MTEWRQLLQIFLDDNEVPYGDRLTPAQIQIIEIIATRKYPRTQLILPTQYGKSLAVALAVLLRIGHHKERWAIVAPTEDKARIIMDYIIDHIFDDVVFSEQLEYNGNKEKLKQERSKTRITFRDGGEVRVYSGNAGNTKQVKKALMGFGAPNIILDESGQIPDELYSTVKRMLGGTKDNFLLEIGNPSFRNHFMRTWFGGRYRKVFVDVYMALAEGRYTQDFVDEMKEEVGFEWLYECLFPEADEMLGNGYRRMLSDLVLNDAMIDQEPELKYLTDDFGARKQNKWGFDIIDDDPILGIDVAGGGPNSTKFVIRFPKHGFAKVVATSGTDDLDEVADIAETLIRQYNIQDYRTVVDAGGVGHGLDPILRNRGHFVKAVLFGESAPEKAFANMRAYMYWESRKWIKKEGGKLLRDVGFLELELICYKQTSSLKLQIEPKAEMIKRKATEGEKVQSPDTADAFVLTFVDTSAIVTEDDIIFD